MNSNESKNPIIISIYDELFIIKSIPPGRWLINFEPEFQNAKHGIFPVSASSNIETKG